MAKSKRSRQEEGARDGAKLIQDRWPSGCHPPHGYGTGQEGTDCSQSHATRADKECDTENWHQLDRAGARAARLD